MAQNKKKLSVLIIIIYLILLFPYIIASNAGDSGIVIENNAMNMNALPNDIQDMLIYKKNSYNVILIKDPVTEEQKVVVSKETQEKGSFVRIDDITTDIFATSYNIIDRPFEKLVIGDAKKAGSGYVIETLNIYMEQLNSYFSSDVFSLSGIVAVSKIDFFAGGIVVALVMTFIFNRMVALWNIPAIAALYSFQSFIAIVISFQNGLEVERTSLMFGFLFILALPLTLWLYRYEGSEKGRRTIHRSYVKNNEILARIMHKFGVYIKSYI